jgi:hypothetical protein
LVVGGDVNMCITGPRDEAEAEETQALLEWAAEHGATALPIGGPTHRGPFGCTQLDWIAVPTQGHWEWGTQLRWYGGLSDHACVVASRSGAPASTGRHCNPASLALLPAAAFTDLRLRYRHLGHMFGLTATQGQGDCGLQRPPQPAAPRDEEFRGEDGAEAILSERQERSNSEEGRDPRTAQSSQGPMGEDGGGSGNGDQPDDDIAMHPGMARYGGPCCSACFGHGGRPGPNVAVQQRPTRARSSQRLRGPEAAPALPVPSGHGSATSARQPRRFGS